MKLTIKSLENCFEKAKKNPTANYIGVKISMKGFEKPEIIINSKENFDAKLEYYKNAYDEELNHKHADGIKIIGFTYGEFFEDIENDLI